MVVKGVASNVLRGRLRRSTITIAKLVISALGIFGSLGAGGFSLPVKSESLRV